MAYEPNIPIEDGTAPEDLKPKVDSIPEYMPLWGGWIISFNFFFFLIKENKFKSQMWVNLAPT